MKFPKSLHAEGWDNHIDATTSATTPKSTKPLGHAPLRGAKPVSMNTRLNEPVAPALSTTPPLAATPTPIITPRVDPIPAAAHPQTRGAAALPPQRDSQLPWMMAAGVGAAIVASIAVWSLNRPSEAPLTPPAVVTGSTAPQTEVAAAMPEPAPAADRDTTSTSDTAAAEPTPSEAVKLGPPVTTVKPAEEPRQVAKAEAPAPRQDLVVRANPRNATVEPERTTPYLQPTAPVTVAAAPAPAPTPAPAPVMEQQPLAVTPGATLGAAPVAPPTAAGPSTAPAQPVTPVPATPDPAVANSTSPGTPPLAQAALPAPEDSGITVKVRSALAADSTLAAVPISVSTDHGVVKLEGQAPDAPTRERATVVAASAGGVKAVDNRLTLPPGTVVGQAVIN